MSGETKQIYLHGRDCDDNIIIVGVTIVDAEDYDKLAQYQWHLCNGYPARIQKRNRKSRRIYMHRAIMNEPENMHVDHIDGVPLNNIKSNLRVCSHRNNLLNAVSRRGSSQYKGVQWYKYGAKWIAMIHPNRKKIHLGYFEDEVEAAKAYDKAALQLFGEFAKTNFPAEL